MKFPSYNKRHRKFNLKKSDKIRKYGEGKQSFNVQMRGVLKPYHSYVPEMMLIKKKDIFNILYEPLSKLALLLSIYFFALYILKKIYGWFFFDYYTINDYENLFFTLFILAYLFIYTYTEYLTYENQSFPFFKLSNKGIEIDKLYTWDEIEKIKIIENPPMIFYKKVLFLLFITDLFNIYKKYYLYFEVPKEDLKIKINLKAYKYDKDLIQYMVNVFQDRFAKRKIRKIDEMEEIFQKKRY